MTAEFWNDIFRWSAPLLAILAALSTIGSLYTGAIVSGEKDAEIALLKSRDILDTDKNRLVTALKTRHGQIGFKSKFLDGESLAYAKKLQEVFKSAGWVVEDDIDRTSTNDFLGFLAVRFTDPGLLALAKFICGILNEVQIECRPVAINDQTYTGGMKENSIYLFVGQKK